MNRIFHGDSLEVLKTLDADSVDLVCTDPPYGYSFMGKSWDKTLPNIGIFKECLRVLKPGAFAFVMSAPRSDVCARMMLLLEDAGFNIAFTPIYWTYASGFPKAMNIGKTVDKRNGTEREVIGRNPNSRENAGIENSLYEPGTVGKTAHITTGSSPLEGSYGGFQPKPAVEVIIVAMKPLSETTFVDQALTNGKGITWLDDCRVPTVEDISNHSRSAEAAISKGKYGDSKAQETHKTLGQELGRFPANLLVSDDVLNDGRVQKSGTAVRRNKGHVKSANINFAHGTHDAELTDDLGYGDSGSYSRFFSLDAWSKTLPFLIVPKASKREKNEGLGGISKKGRPLGISQWKGQTNGSGEVMGASEPQANHHPTVKPLTLMQYLITLGSRPGDVVLDPFLGSGTTAVAAKTLGRQYTGIEREKEYVDISEARLTVLQGSLL